MGVKIGVKKTVEVEAKEIRLYVKVCDEFVAYVPKFFPGNHYGDYLILNIDIETGQITNWTAPNGEELRDMFFGDEKN